MGIEMAGASRIDHRRQAVVFSGEGPSANETKASVKSRILDRWSSRPRAAGYRGTIEAFGEGSSRFGDLDESIPLDERYHLARRVDVIILQKKKG